MSNTTIIETINKNPREAWTELEELRNHLYGVYANLNLIQIGIEDNGYSEISEALSPLIDSLIYSYKKADDIMEALRR